MPIFSDLGLYYSGTSVPSHLYASPRYNVYSGPPSRPLPARIGTYSPLLPTISESSSLSPVFSRRAVPLSRMASPRTFSHVPTFQPSRPIRMDTADIDVSAPRRYGRVSRGERQGTIKRDRPLVRLQTKKASGGKPKTRGEQLVEKFLIKDKPAVREEPVPETQKLKEMELLDCILAEEQTASEEETLPRSRRSSEVDLRVLESCENIISQVDGDVGLKDTAKKKKKKKKAKSDELEDSLSEVENISEKTNLKRRNTIKNIRKVSLDLLTEPPDVHRLLKHSGEENAKDLPLKSPAVDDSDSFQVSDSVPITFKQQKNKISFEVSVDNNDDIILKSKSLPFRIIVDNVQVEENVQPSRKTKPKKFRYKITVEDDKCDLRKSVKHIKRFLTSKKVNENFLDTIISSAKLDETEPSENKVSSTLQSHQTSSLDIIKKTATDKNVHFINSISVTESYTGVIDKIEGGTAPVVDDKKCNNGEHIRTPESQDAGCKDSESSTLANTKMFTNQELLCSPQICESTENIKILPNKCEENLKEISKTSETQNIPVIEKLKEKVFNISGNGKGNTFPKNLNKAQVLNKRKEDKTTKIPNGKCVPKDDSLTFVIAKEENQTAVTKNKLNIQSSSSDMSRHQVSDNKKLLPSTSVAKDTHVKDTQEVKTEETSEENAASADASIDFWALLKSPSVTEVTESGRTVLRYKRTLSSSIPEDPEQMTAEHICKKSPETETKDIDTKHSEIVTVSNTIPSQKEKKKLKLKSHIQSLNVSEVNISPSLKGNNSKNDSPNILLNSVQDLSKKSVPSGKITQKLATIDISLSTNSATEFAASNLEFHEKTITSDNQTGNANSFLQKAGAVIDSIHFDQNKSSGVIHKPSKLKQMYEELSSTLETAKTSNTSQEEGNKSYLEMIESLSQIAQMGTNVPLIRPLDNNTDVKSSQIESKDSVSETNDKVDFVEQQKVKHSENKPSEIHSLVYENKVFKLNDEKESQKKDHKTESKLKITNFAEKQTATKTKIHDLPKTEIDIQLESPNIIKSKLNENYKTPGQHEKKSSTEKTEFTNNNETKEKDDASKKDIDKCSDVQSHNNAATVPVQFLPQEDVIEVENKTEIKADLQISKHADTPSGVIETDVATPQVNDTVNNELHEDISVNSAQKLKTSDTTGAIKTSPEDKNVETNGKVSALQGKNKGKNVVAKVKPGRKQPLLKTKSADAAISLEVVDGGTEVSTDTSVTAAKSLVVGADNPEVTTDISVVAAESSVEATNSSTTSAGCTGAGAAAEANSPAAAADGGAAGVDAEAKDGGTKGDEKEDGSSSEDEDTLTEDSDEEGEGSGPSKQSCSSSSEDSGFDSRPSSENKHGTCSSDSSKDSSSSTTLLVNSPDLRLDGFGLEEARGRGRTSSGRVTPPATTIPRYRKYTIDDFHFLKVLGKGSYGKVLLAELKNTECYYAVKCLKKDVVLEDDDVECTLIERKVLALGTKHPYLCHLFATFQTESHLFFVMEYLNGGDLMFHIQQSGRFPEARARFYAAEIVSGLRFLHKKGIVYRDLKLDNVLLDFDGHIRIADFGMCKLQIFLDRTADTFCGTPDYMAPEVIKGQKYNQCVDWWSFGVLLFEMLVGQSPFSGCDEDDLFWCICNEQPQIPRHLSKEASSMLALLLEKDSSKRLGTPQCEAGDVVDQPFFRPIDWAALERRELEPPFRPRVKHPLDVQYFDKTFTNERAKITPVERSILQSMDQTQFQGFSYTNPNATE